MLYSSRNVRFWYITHMRKVVFMDVLVLSARGLYFGKRLYLYPFSARVDSEGSGETVCMCSCFLAFGLY